MYICINGSGTYPCTLLSKRLLTVEKLQEKHKRINKDGAFCCGYSGDSLGRFFMWASTFFFEHLYGGNRNNFCGQVIPHIHYSLAEGKLAQMKPRSIL